MKNLLIAVFTVSFLSACATSKLATEQIENAAIKQAAEANITPKQAVKDARNALLKANSDELSYYTPLHFKDAQESLEKLEALQKERTPVNDTELDLEIITESFKTQQFIDSAYQSKAIIESTLSESLSLKSELDEMNCKKEFPEAYSEMNEELIDLFKLIEQNKAEKARSRETDLLADMGDLEMKTLINIYVKPAVFILEKAEDFDADDYAEKTFEQAELSIKRAEAFIKVNYRKRNAVKQIGLEALIAAKKALNIGELSHSMVDLDEGDAEAKALEIDALFETVIDGFAAQDLRGLTLKEQAQALAELARVNNSRIKGLTADLTAVEADNKELVSKIAAQKSANEAANNELMSKLAAQKAANEALNKELAIRTAVQKAANATAIKEAAAEDPTAKAVNEAVSTKVVTEDDVAAKADNVAVSKTAVTEEASTEKIAGDVVNKKAATAMVSTDIASK